MQNIIRIAIAAALLFLIEYYFTRKVVKGCRNYLTGLPEKRRRTIFKVFFIWLNLYPLFLIFDWSYAAYSGTYVWVPQNFFFDYFLIYPFWYGFILVVQCDLLFLILDLLKFLILPIWRKRKLKLLQIEAKIILFITAFFILYVPIRIIHDRTAISIRVVEYKKKGLPEALNNFRLTFISDIQADSYTDQNRLMDYISKVNSTNPDLVLIGGDVITSTPNYINEAADYISKINSKYGVFSCVGDHDNWAYHENYKKSLNEVTSALKKKNIKMIDDGYDILNVHGARIGITFVTNTYVERIPVSRLDSLADLKGKFDLKIFLTHQPREYMVESAIKYNYDLYLAGHTHGGQITFLFPFINLSPTLIETSYVRGNFYFSKSDGEKLLMIVTRGLGMSIAPVRYNSTPEITLIIMSKG